MKTKLLLGTFVAALAAAASCGGSGDSTTAGSGFTGTGTAGTAGTAGTTGTGSGVGGGGIGCDPACTAPQTCSVLYTCIDPGACAGDLDCEGGKICVPATQLCVIGGACGAEEASAEAVPPNLLMVLDRSCSMVNQNELVGGQLKWTVAVQAINTLTTAYVDKIRFGLTLFPDLVAPSCGQDAIAIPVSPGNEIAIQTLLNAALTDTSDPYYPNGPCVTNIDTAMEQATTEPAFLDLTRDSYAVLITDGKQSSGCAAAGGDNGTTQIITDLLTAGVPTFVIGFGGGVDPVQMDIFAEAGGVPSAGANKYYNADDQASLDAALQSIAEKTLGCIFTLGSTPPDPSKIYVFFDNQSSVPKDPSHMNGWDYDPATNQVTFYGAACDSLKAGTVTDVDVVFGCDEPTPD